MSFTTCCSWKIYTHFEGFQDFKQLEVYNLESLISYRWEEIQFKTYGRLEPLDLAEYDRLKVPIKYKMQIDIDDEIGQSLWAFWKYLKKLYPSYRSQQKHQVIDLYKFLSMLLFQQKVKHRYLIAWIFELAQNCKPVRKYIVQEECVKMNFILNRLLSRNEKLCIMERLKKELNYNKCFWSLKPEQFKVLLQNGIYIKMDLMFTNSNLHRHFDIRGRKARRRVTKKYFRKRLLFVLMMYNAFNFTGADRIRCLENMRLLWKTIPQPFLTSKEMKEKLFYVSSKGQQSEVDRVCLEYDQEFASPVPKPRSLQHYARCTIRSLLDHNNPLKKFIDNLPISERCRPYLQLDI